MSNKHLVMKSSSFYHASVLMIMVWFLCPITVQGGSINRATIEHDEGRFIVHSNVLVRSPMPDVSAILTQFENLPRINTGIKKVKILQLQGDRPVRMRVKSEVCVLFVCLDYQWVQDVKIPHAGEIITRFDPAESDFRQGWVRYRLIPEGEYTRLVMDADLVPDFWFPPIIGTMIIKDKLHDQALETARRIEEIAQVRNVANRENRLASYTRGAR